jgi:hypothetical protein
VPFGAAAGDALAECRGDKLDPAASISVSRIGRFSQELADCPDRLDLAAGFDHRNREGCYLIFSHDGALANWSRRNW